MFKPVVFNQYHLGLFYFFSKCRCFYSPFYSFIRGDNIFDQGRMCFATNQSLRSHSSIGFDLHYLLLGIPSSHASGLSTHHQNYLSASKSNLIISLSPPAVLGFFYSPLSSKYCSPSSDIFCHLLFLGNLKLSFSLIFSQMIAFHNDCSLSKFLETLFSVLLIWVLNHMCNCLLGKYLY